MSDDFDFSDLTELDDEPEIPLSQTSPSKRGKKNDNPQLITGALRIPRTANYSAESLYSQMVSGDINLDADYQRDVVWPDTKQIGAPII
ncbi:hypothetical protein QCA50_008400 [Cerrena zonata]|uniref:Uncharacterized protein n=1 Tax=Cerrena zonata TaxID=2478898 RepID=A0AAW0GG91_9APHY